MTICFDARLTLAEYPLMRRHPTYAGHLSTDTSTTRFEAEVTQLFRARFSSLVRYLDRSLDDWAMASDIAQESFVRLVDRGAMPAEPSAWLITVARNLVRDQARTRGRHLRLVEAAGDEIPHPGPSPDPAAALAQSEQRQQVRSALDRLSPRDREVLLLRHSGYSYREISVALDLTETNVSTILLRASAAFRTAYQELHGAND